MRNLPEVLWYVSGPVTALRLAELVLFAFAAWFCWRKNRQSAVEMICIAWTVAALDSVCGIIGSLSNVSGPGHSFDAYQTVVPLLAGFPLSCLLTLVVTTALPRNFSPPSLTWAMKAQIAIPFIAMLDLLLFAVVLLPLLQW
jgi:hypothetical protein